jgi:hypothetical protein
MGTVYYGERFNLLSILFCGEYVSLSLSYTMAAPRYRTNYGMGITCSDIFKINDVLVQYDASGNPVIVNNQTNTIISVPYRKCPNLSNPNGGMATSTNNTNITKKMLYAQNIRVASETKNVKKAYAVNNINRFGRWTGAPGGFGGPITNSF